MKIVHKSILDTLINYQTKREPNEVLKKAFDKLGDKEIVTLIGRLLSWHKESFLGLEDANKCEISDVIYTRLNEFFKHCDELEMMFKLTPKHVIWNENLSEMEIDEIRNYIHENYKIQIRIRRDLRKK